MLYYKHRKEVNKVSDLIDILKAVIAGVIIQIIGRVADYIFGDKRK